VQGRPAAAPTFNFFVCLQFPLLLRRPTFRCPGILSVDLPRPIFFSRRTPLRRTFSDVVSGCYFPVSSNMFSTRIPDPEPPIWGSFQTSSGSRLNFKFSSFESEFVLYFVFPLPFALHKETLFHFSLFICLVPKRGPPDALFLFR